MLAKTVSGVYIPGGGTPLSCILSKIRLLEDLNAAANEADLDLKGLS
jgi:hypothetical protein